MIKRKFIVQIYFTGFCTYEVESSTEAEAVELARDKSIIQEELLTNLENWKEADSVYESNDEKNT